MGFRQVYEKHVKRWTAHIALGMFLLAVAIHVAHLLGVLHWVPEGVLLETLGFASLFLITLLLESLHKQVESATRQIHLRDYGGRTSHRFVEEVKHICHNEKQEEGSTKEKEISIYRSLNTNSLREVNELIVLASQSRRDLVKIYHTYGMEFGSWVMGTNDRADETEVLLNYSNPHGNSLAGLHLFGPAAESFARASFRTSAR